MKQLLKTIWKALPENIRDTKVALKAREIVSSVSHENNQKVPNEIPVPEFLKDKTSLVYLDCIEDIDKAFEYADSFKEVSEIKRWGIIRSVALKYPEALKNIDPSSTDYKQSQMYAYKSIANKDYSTENERTKIYVTEALDRPYPYNSEDPQVVADDLSTTARIIKAMNLKPGERILECGPGWGNNTIQFAQIGYEVTAVDIEKNFIELISRRLKQLNKKATLIQGDFFSVSELQNGYYDAVLFDNCFHHCSNHRGLIDELAKVMKPEGKLVFSDEPIDNSFPVPWGLRFDGESLYQIRNNGWLELGFQEDYFIQMLETKGFYVEELERDSSRIRIIVAKKKTS